MPVSSSKQADPFSLIKSPYCPGEGIKGYSLQSDSGLPGVPVRQMFEDQQAELFQNLPESGADRGLPAFL